MRIRPLLFLCALLLAGLAQAATPTARVRVAFDRDGITDTQTSGYADPATYKNAHGEALLDASEAGGSKAFKRAMKERGLDMATYLYRERREDEVFPWDRIDIGVTRKYLFDELQKAETLQSTPACFEGCHRCGVC